MTDQEPYTRVPNVLLDNMHRFTPAEFRVLMALVRRIVGFNKACDVVSVSQLMAMTKLSNRHVIDCLDSLVAQGVIAREPAKRNGFCYRLVNSVHQWTQFTSELSSPEPVNSVHESEPQLVNSVHTQKKESKEKKEKGVRAPRATPAPRKTDVVFEALAGVCGIDWHVCTKEQRDQLNQSTGLIRKAGGKAGKSDEEVAETVRYVAGYFRRMDWRGKRGETPTPAQIREVWGAAIQERDRQRRPEVEPETPATPKPIRISAAERAARIAAARQNEGTR